MSDETASPVAQAELAAPVVKPARRRASTREAPSATPKSTREKPVPSAGARTLAAELIRTMSAASNTLLVPTGQVPAPPITNFGELQNAWKRWSKAKTGEEHQKYGGAYVALMQAMYNYGANHGHGANALRMQWPQPAKITLDKVLTELAAVEKAWGHNFIPAPSVGQGVHSVQTPKFIIKWTCDGKDVEVPLGPFNVNIHPSSGESGRSGTYRVHPGPGCRLDQSGSRHHPHITSNKLCEGEATALLTKAWVGGRMFDFFEIMYGVLNNYNPSSPYAPIENWFAAICGGCGAKFVDDGDWRCAVTQCSKRVCKGCRREVKGGSVCYAHVATCFTCKALTTTTHCRASIKDGNLRCVECHGKHVESSKKKETVTDE